MLRPGLLKLATTALSDLKAQDVRVLDVRRLTSITDHMVVASGTSGRHVRSIADRLIEAAKKAGQAPLGVEGQESGEWVLVDLEDVVVHIMQPRIREFYKLEDLWTVESPVTARRAD
jgi:ribosome-associated protein